MNGVSCTVGALAGTGTADLGSTPGTALTLAAGSGTFAGVVTGTGDLIVSGSTNQWLSGVNTYTGNTTVSGGVLNLAHHPACFPRAAMCSCKAAPWRLTGRSWTPPTPSP